MTKQISFWKPVKTIKIKPFLNLKSYPKRTKAEVRLIDRNPFGDTDRDKVPNWFDCRPLNKNWQGKITNTKKSPSFFPYRKKAEREKLPRIKPGPESDDRPEKMSISVKDWNKGRKNYYPYKNLAHLKKLPRVQSGPEDYRPPGRQVGPEGGGRFGKGRLNKKDWNKLQKARSIFFIMPEGSESAVSERTLKELQKSGEPLIVDKNEGVRLVEKAQRVEHGGRSLRRPSSRVKSDKELKKWYTGWLIKQGIIKIASKRKKKITSGKNISKITDLEEDDEKRLAGLTLEDEDEDDDKVSPKKVVKKIAPASAVKMKPSAVKPILSSSIIDGLNQKPISQPSIITPILSPSIPTSQQKQVNDEELIQMMMQNMGKMKDEAKARINAMTAAQKQEYYDFIKKGKLKDFRHYKKVKPFSWNKKGAIIYPSRGWDDDEADRKDKEKRYDMETDEEIDTNLKGAVEGIMSSTPRHEKGLALYNAQDFIDAPMREVKRKNKEDVYASDKIWYEDVEKREKEERPIYAQELLESEGNEYIKFDENNEEK